MLFLENGESQRFSQKRGHEMLGVYALGAAVFFIMGFGGASEVSAQNGRDLEILVVYDNYSCRSDLETGWGFSCLIRGMEKTILFDTGGSGAVLMRNMEKMAISPEEIDAVVLSHIHGDHTGGLQAFLERKGRVTVYVPGSFPDRFKEAVRSYGAEVVSVREPLSICQDVFSTGEMGTFTIEQSLVLRSKSGLIVITGCAHPGIVKIIEEAKAQVEGEVLLAMGGFHLMGMSMGNLKKVFARFHELGVRYVGPCHCTGETQIKAFQKVYEEHFLKMGVGKVIRIEELN
jgi:7,8-dihydropterin-6-yl-methyl-4-(beta-D-ribofuranosyl)aminobenzene 5'-phosphate synthase